jgi:DNA polymerase (family 10)
VAELVRSGRARELRGIGAGIETRLRELVETGEIAELAELERELTPELVGLGRFLGLTATRSMQIAKALDVATAEELRQAAEAGRLRAVPGIGPKLEARLLEALSREAEARPRRGLLLSRAWELLGRIADAVDGEVAGDPRRWRDSCEFLAVVCAAPDPAPVIAEFEALPQVVALLDRDERRAVGVTVDGVPVELVAAEANRFGTALVRATGSERYVEALEPLPDAADELGVYAALGIPWCPPELREEPFAGEPPALLELPDIRGDLHCHTTWSDGRASVEEMGLAARERGYEYVAICDHTPAVGAVRGLAPDDVRRQADEIAAANERLAPFRVLRGIECDILPDGRLDLPDDVLSELDWVQASVHGGQRMPRREMTRRVEEALRNPYVRCLSHPKGRYINRRPENALDLERVFEVALEEGVALEVNGLPDRLDLSGDHVRDALRVGVTLVCSTDAHSVGGLENMALSVVTARRGWATAANVLNTHPLNEVLRR